MKSKQLTKFKIGFDSQGENDYKTQIEAKNKAFKELLDYCNTFVLIQDLKTFSEAPTSYFKDAFLVRYENDFSPLIPYETKLSLSNISLSKIQRLEAQFLAIDIKNFDVITCKAPKLDFNIYAVDKESIERYEKTNQLIECLNQLRENVICYPALIIQGTSNSITFDFKTNSFAPNLAYIQGTIR